MDRSRHTVTKYLSNEKTHGAIKNRMFKRLSYMNDQMYEVELVKPETEQEEPTIVGFFYPAISKIENARAVLKLLWQLLRFC